MTEMTDKEILEQFRTESSRHYAFNLLIRKYQQRIYYHIRRMILDHDDAHDVTQETFIKVWKGLDNFREDSQLYTWLYRIATNESLTFLRQKKRRFTIPWSEVEHEMSDSLSGDSHFNANALELKLQKALLTLPPKQRLVFNLRYYDNMKYEDMSKVLGVTEGALKASYHHAVKKVEKYLTGS